MTPAEVPSAPPDGVPPATNRKAIYSVVFGVLAFACLYVFPFGALALGIPSITSGVHARREIAASKGDQGGDSVAVIGLMIGAGALVTFVLSGLVTGGLSNVLDGVLHD